MGLTPIDPTLFITDNDPTAVKAKKVSAWFTTETQEDVSEENIVWMLAQGWTVTNTEKDENGFLTYKVTRRQVDSEKILTALVADYTTAYNEGRQLNDSRYDEIVTLYSVMQNNSQLDWLSREAGNSNAETIILSLAAAMGADYDAYEAYAGYRLDDYGDSIVEEINTRFDNLLTTQSQDLTSRGMYNSTLWSSVSAGVERERSKALNDAGDKITRTQLDQDNRLADAKSTMRSKVIAATERLWQLLQTSSDTRLASRNAVMESLLRFMERRTDSYPSLDEIGRLATALGAGNAAGFQP